MNFINNHMYGNLCSWICDMWLNKVTYLLAYLLNPQNTDFIHILSDQYPTVPLPNTAVLEPKPVMSLMKDKPKHIPRVGNSWCVQTDLIRRPWFRFPLKSIRTFVSWSRAVSRFLPRAIFESSVGNSWVYLRNVALSAELILQSAIYLNLNRRTGITNFAGFPTQIFASQLLPKLWNRFYEMCISLVAIQPLLISFTYGKSGPVK